MDNEVQTLFERQFSTFLELFKQDDLLDVIPEEHHANVINLMVTAAFHVSLAGRVYAIQAMKNGGMEGPLMQEFLADTQSAFDSVGVRMEDVLEHAKQIQGVYRPSLAQH